MTAVLQGSDIFGKVSSMAAHDNPTINYSNDSIDWKAKYDEAAEMLEITRQELDDFQKSSGELEVELERELERTEKAQQDLMVKVARTEQERDEWKSKFMSLQTTHNTTTTSLQRELDTLRAEHQKIKIQFRELEMGNDDLERNERAISSSLADIESKYARVLEEKILLEHELLDKANVEEESQRFKDELRDANEEINILKDQLAAAQSRPSDLTDTDTAPSSVLSHTTSSLSDEAETPSDLSPNFETPSRHAKHSSIFTTPQSIKSPQSSSPVQSRIAQRSNYSSTSATMLPRSTTAPSLTPTTSSRSMPARISGSRSIKREASATSSTGTAPKSRGVQMVSEMRARVKVLEQKLIGRTANKENVANRAGTSTAAATSHIPAKSRSNPLASSPVPSTSSSRSSLHESRNGQSSSKRQSLGADGFHGFDSAESTPNRGWVRTSASSPTAPSAFRHVHSPNEQTGTHSRAPSAASQNSAYSGRTRPPSGLSINTGGRTSVSTMATTDTASSIPTPSSRPSTPTSLPLPISSTYRPSFGLKSSPVTGSPNRTQTKRPSLQKPTTPSSPRTLIDPASRPNLKASVLGSGYPSRIARPASASVGRKSIMDPSDPFYDPITAHISTRRMSTMTRTRSVGTPPQFGRQ
ncbi:hypothetical protein WOLCODRAFT_135341 [Wolfiporia cocos MD-104 SS10]|uniref:NUDE domain-containing protein n=1 Tax=Wolfiporia cocos (strain MD-104) TaxID=742152 RepID=A0A2H3JCY6_WOLCO|nr:hypothetical protein WOLCODRAFT_135341 [Wolfiporia cocos MD-104 SS10]